MRIQSGLSGDRRALQSLRKLGKEGQKAVTRAINNTGRRATTLANREIRSQVNLKSAYVRERLKVRRATGQRAEFLIRANRRGVLMSRYPYRQLPRGVSVKVSRRGPRVRLRNAFVVPLTAGGRRVEAIADVHVPGGRGRGRNRKRWRTGNMVFRVLYSPSVSQVFAGVRDQITAPVSEYFAEQMDKELARVKRRIAG